MTSMQAGVAVVPLSAFVERAPRHLVRLCFGNKDETGVAAMVRAKELLA